MDLSAYRYRSTFTATAKVVAPTEQDRFVAKASLQPLKHLLPADVDPAASPDLLFISCNGAVAGLVNRNNDAISCETALAINATARNKYINVEHERDQVIGVILYPGFTRFGSNEPLDAATAASLKEPFNMAFAGVIWKTVAPMISKYLVRVDDSTESDALSMSWEIAFSTYDIGVGSANLFDTQIVKASDPKFADYDKCLWANGGNGKDKAGNRVSRIITGDPIILGYSVVPNPAAEVKGILPVVKQSVADTDAAVASLTEAVEAFSKQGLDTTEILKRLAQADANMTVSVSDFVAAVERAGEVTADAGVTLAVVARVVSSEKTQEKSITPSDTRVTPHTQPMKIENVSQIESQWSELRKLESAASIVDFVRKMEEQSKLYLADKEAKEQIVKTVAEEKQKTDEKVTTLEQSIATLQKELKDVRDAAAASELAAKFQERMQQFDAAFDLDASDRKIIAKHVKTLTDEAFATYFEEAQVLMAGKAKGKKAPPFGKDKKKDDDEDKKDGGKDEDKESDAATIKEAVASVKETPDQTKPVNGVVEIDVSIAAQIKDAFGSSFKVNGKAAKDITPDASKK